MKVFLSILFSVFISETFNAEAQKLIESSSIQPKVFIENKGQVVDENNKPNPGVKFLYHDGLMNLAFKNTGFSYEIFKIIPDQNGFYESGSWEKEDAERFKEEMNFSIQSIRIDVSFEGANKNVMPVESSASEVYFNYYYAPVSTNQYLQVKGFQKIVYQNLYNGIDLVFYAADENESSDLHYEFIIHPGADFSKIKFKYSGPAELSCDSKGDFQINTSIGFIAESKPKYFIDGKEEFINGNFEIKNSSRTFSSIKYDHSKFMIIDPNIIWGTYYGGEKGDEIAEVVIDAKNKASLCGHTVSINHIATAGAYQTSFAGGIYDLFLSHFKTNGKIDWATYFGGIDKDFAFGLGVDSKNNLIVAGNSLSQGLATAGAFKDSVLADKSDILLAKFSSLGALLWSTYYGGDGSENPRNIISDSKDKLYVAGTTGSSNGIAYGNSFQSTLGGYDDTWIAKFTSDGWPVWSTYYGGGGVDRAHALNLDGKGNLFVGGTCNSVDSIATSGAFHENLSALNDAYLSKFDTAGNFIWGTYIGGDQEDRTRGVDCDSIGNVYIAGFTQSDSGIATSGSHQPDWFEGYFFGVPTEDAYLMKFNADGVRQWGTYYGGTKNEELWGMFLDRKAHSLYTCGSAASTTNISFGESMQPEKSGGQDGFLSKWKEDGTIDWGTYWGGEEGYQFEDCMAAADNFLYVCGRATNSSIPVTGDTYQKNFYGGSSDAMLYKFYTGNDCLDQYEPNESSAAAYLLKGVSKFDTTIYGWNGSIKNSADQDWFKVKVKGSNKNYKIILKDLPQNYDLNFFDVNGSLLYQSVNAGTTADTIIANNLLAATYTLQIVHDASVFDSLGCYHLTINNSNVPFKISNQINLYREADKITCFPNPSNNEISFSIFSDKEVTAGLVIYDLLGREADGFTLQLNEGEQKISIPIEKIVSGAYQLVIISQYQSWKGKFIKQ
jgi:hypothetical protein